MRIGSSEDEVLILSNIEMVAQKSTATWHLMTFIIPSFLENYLEHKHLIFQETAFHALKMFRIYYRSITSATRDGVKSISKISKIHYMELFQQNIRKNITLTFHIILGNIGLARFKLLFLQTNNWCAIIYYRAVLVIVRIHVIL